MHAAAEGLEGGACEIAEDLELFGREVADSGDGAFDDELGQGNLGVWILVQTWFDGPKDTCHYKARRIERRFRAEGFSRGGGSGTAAAAQGLPTGVSRNVRIMATVSAGRSSISQWPELATTPC